jgi:peptidoglycan/xylan/chitin deacetylase (PgdA/CDA1 family)
MAQGSKAMTEAAGTLTISLDFELFWGVHDTRSLQDYGDNILGARAAIPRLLDLFARYEIGCTWATVGFLFFDDKEDLLSHLPDERPDYANPALSPYRLIPDIGAGERADPYHYGLSLIRLINGCPGQEIGTHTFSHYYCLEDGPTLESFRADLLATQRAAGRLGITVRSVVFPRNQTSAPHLRICRELGIEAYRGNERSWIYRARSRRAESLLRRGGRLADSYVPITGPNCLRPIRDASGMVDIPSSCFLRPVSRQRRALEGLRLRRIRNSMTYAALTGTVYHLWFHPHNFGADTDSNLSFLGSILEHFQRLREHHGMRSRSMAQIATELGPEPSRASLAERLEPAGALAGRS